MERITENFSSIKMPTILKEGEPHTLPSGLLSNSCQ